MFSRSNLFLSSEVTAFLAITASFFLSRLFLSPTSCRIYIPDLPTDFSNKFPIIKSFSSLSLGTTLGLLGNNFVLFVVILLLLLLLILYLDIIKSL